MHFDGFFSNFKVLVCMLSDEFHIRSNFEVTRSKVTRVILAAGGALCFARTSCSFFQAISFFWCSNFKLENTMSNSNGSVHLSDSFGISIEGDDSLSSFENFVFTSLK